MNILSLFDGISCGQYTLNQMGVDIDSYYASEICQESKNVTQRHYPNTIQLGDINNFLKWKLDWSSIDLVFAGFPCQKYSKAGSQLGLAADDLLLVAMRVLNKVREYNPSVKYLFENVYMSKENLREVNQVIGHTPKVIDTRKFLPQKRLRLYWTNLSVNDLPDDQHTMLTLKDIVEEANVPTVCKNFIDMSKSEYILKLAVLPNVIRKEVHKSKYSNELISLMTSISPDNVLSGGEFIQINHLGQNGSIYDVLCGTLTQRKPAVVDYNPLGKLCIRYLSPEECELLQGLPIDYTLGQSLSSRYSMIGNGWSVPVIKHLLSNL